MKKIIAALLVLSILAVPVVAQLSHAQVTSTVKLRALVVLGKGIASNPGDPMDFMILKFGLGKAAAGNRTLTVGVLVADDQRYRLRDVVIEEGHATGNIYDNGTQVGSFDMSSVMKGDTEIWAGTLTLGGQSYNAYVIEGARKIRPAELRERVVEYCNNNEDANCRERLQNYCENNPEDLRCRALFRAYCMKADNMDDTRCREAFRNYCAENSSDSKCVPFELNRSRSYCERESDSNLCKKIGDRVADFCTNNPDNEGCAVVKKLIQERPQLLQNIQNLRDRISNLRTTAISNADGMNTAAGSGGG
jgi:hypothetical protein